MPFFISSDYLYASETALFDLFQPELTFYKHLSHILYAVLKQFGYSSGDTYMKRIHFYLFATMFCLIAGLSATTSYAESQNNTISDSTFSIQGTVADFSTNKPITNATVAVQGQNISVQTNSSGSFELDGLHKGTYTINVTADGYRDYDNTFKIDSDTDEVTIKLTPTGNH